MHTLRLYRQNAAHGSLGLSWIHFSPYLHDFDQEAGTASGHYFHQDICTARKIYATRPAVHVEIGSHIDGFVAHLLTFMPITVIDFRPLQSTVAGLTFMQADATDIQGLQDNNIESLSSLHAVEHFGFGRYGEPSDRFIENALPSAFAGKNFACGLFEFTKS